MYFLYKNTESIVLDEASKQATSVAITVSKFIEQDIDSYKTLSAVSDYTTGNYDQAYYQKMLIIFHDIKDKAGLDYLFTEKKLSDVQIAYILDGEDPGSDKFSPIGSTDTMGVAELMAFDQGIVTASGLIKDPVWGLYLTGFAPIIYPSTGEVVGLVGVDFSAAHIVRIISHIQNLLIIAFLSLTGLTSIVVDRLIEMRSKSINTDYPTKLYSKHYFTQYISDVIEEANKSQQPFSLIMMDIDNFKSYNDEYGHVFGDRVILSVADTIKSSTRSMDSCFRYGGDEFIVLLPHTSEDQAKTIAKRIQNNLERIQYNVHSNEKISVTLSYGISRWSTGMKPERLVDLADMAMYESKKNGRNQINAASDLKPDEDITPYK